MVKFLQGHNCKTKQIIFAFPFMSFVLSAADQPSTFPQLCISPHPTSFGFLSAGRVTVILSPKGLSTASPSSPSTLTHYCSSCYSSTALQHHFPMPPSCSKWKLSTTSCSSFRARTSIVADVNIAGKFGNIGEVVGECDFLVRVSGRDIEIEFRVEGGRCDVQNHRSMS